MAMSISELEAWDHTALSGLADSLSQRHSTISTLQGQVEEIGHFDQWTGDGADNARISASQIAGNLTTRAASVAALSQLVGELSETVSGLKEDLHRLTESARANDFSVTDFGTVSDARPDQTAEERAAREPMRAQLETDIKAVLDLADDAEDDTVRILDAVIKGEIPGIDKARNAEHAANIASEWADNEFAAPGPPSDVTKQQQWWEDLPQSTRDYILENDPELVTNAYGLDPAVRHEAAVNYIPILRDKLKARRDNHAGTSPRYPFGSPEYQEARDKLADLDAIEKQLAGTDPDEDIQILGLRENDDSIGVVFARGDISTADNIAVMTPGMDTTTRDSLSGKNDLARNLRIEMDRVDALNGEDPDNAVVTYMNMDFPQSLGEAARGDAADTAAPDLADAINGTAHVAGDDVHITAIGHSYGSLTTSEALQEGTAADAAVFYGSPGIESGDDDHDFHPSDLHVPEGNAYAMLAPDDPIDSAPMYGPSPTRIDGIQHLELDPEYLDDAALYKDRTLATGHSGYHSDIRTEGNRIVSAPAAFTNMAAVATDNTDGLETYNKKERSDKLIEDLESLRGRYNIMAP